MKRSIWILMISGVVLISCTRSTGVKPIYPEVGYHNITLIKVDSLQPTFRWKPWLGAVTYDLIIYEAITKPWSFWTGVQQQQVGREIYYREGLKETEHKIEEPLRPRTAYFWSVRIRKGQEVSDWSLYDYPAFWYAINKGWHYPFLFDTPEK
jgi:hypothetical protein